VRARVRRGVPDEQGLPRAQEVGLAQPPVEGEHRVVAAGHVRVHADRGAEPVGPVDAEVLRLLCEAIGMASERLVAEHRTERARHRVQRALVAMESAFEAGGGPGPDRPHADPRPEVEAMLTSREAEVLRLMAAGATNAAIASTLVIAEGTAKTHVKNILRKLEAGNRAEAVSRFLGGTGGDEPA
jgi:ATP/maltotriose-dependent transcriptional regulator MalT